ncbi:MAG: response regulator [Nocardiaceae bacterium]|nr:response regulator [Nocardiaceae bacterium]
MARTRTQTVMFTDVVGSTELFGGLSEDTAVRVFHEHFSTMQRLVDHHGGRVVKTLGDGVMASFDSATNAIDCSIAMQRATSIAPSDGNPQLCIRIGLSSGDVHLDDGDCHGVAVVEAARISALARGGQVLVTETTRLLAREHHTLVSRGTVKLKGLDEARVAWEVSWSRDARPKVRVVLADDAILVREGIARVLTAKGIEVVGQADDAVGLERLTAELRPDLAIVDVRMPPTFTTEGLDAARRIRGRYPDTAVLVLTQSPVPSHAAMLLESSPTAVGYLLKERVSDLQDFIDVVGRVARGDTVVEGIEP